MAKPIRHFLIASLFLLATPLLLAACSSNNSTPPLTAPTNFMASYDSGTSTVNTSWTAGTGEDMFMVMRVEQNTDKTTVMWKVPSTQTTYDDTTTVSGTTYMYMVHGMQGDTVSDPSNKVMVTIP